MLQQMFLIRRTVAFMAVLGMLDACMSPPGRREPDLKAAKQEALPDPPAQSQTVVEKAPPPETIPASIGDMVEDVALIHLGKLICSDGSQCNGTASWANCDFGRPKVAANDEVRVVTEAGVTDMILKLRNRYGERWHVLVAPKSNANEQADEIELALALRNTRPPTTARLEARRLDKVSAAEAKAGREWLEKSFPDSLGPTALKPIGAVAGTFGDGVDRILVFAPKRRLSYEELDELDADGPLDHDVAVLLAGNEPRGILPFGEVTGLEVVYAVDFDGDGTQELVWIAQGAQLTLFTLFSISYFNGSEFATRDVAGCTYAGCDGFLPVEKCGHSQLKWKNGREPR
jgi:hypothetical protein